MKLLSLCRWLILSVVILVLAFPGSISWAQDSIKVSENEVTYFFGSTLEISAKIELIPTPEEIHIILKPEGQVSRQVKLTALSDGRIILLHDLSQDPLRPFSRIYYWYQFELPDGSVMTSPSFWFDYVDNRYQWKQLTSKLFEVYWTGQDGAFGQKIMDMAAGGLEKSTTILPVAPILPIRIYVYPDINALQDTLMLSHQKWVAGHASLELGVVLISDGSDQSNLIDLERQIPHELMHILQYQLTGDAYAQAPAWLLEGLAVTAQSYPNPDDDRILAAAVKTDSLIPLEEMCRSLPIDANDAAIGYAQSNEIVEYLKDRFGSQVFVKMLQSSISGVSCEQNLVNNTGLTSEQLLTAWLEESYSNSSQPSANNNALILYILGGGGIVILIFIAIREIWQKKKTKYD